MANQGERKTRGLVWMCVAYVVATVVGLWVAERGPWPEDLLWQVALADLVATLVIFGFSVALNNSSLYDPYWSVAPMVMALYWGLRFIGDFFLPSLVLLILVWAWGIRLTWNFWRGWPGLHHEDWRYVAFREKTGKLYWLVSFGGIHLFPTVVVFLGMIGAYELLRASRVESWGMFAIAVAVTVMAICIETIADEQLRAFVTQKKEPGEIMKSGLWAYSRHPNYFGEMSFWWGMGLFGLSADPNAWWVLLGPAVITAMFVFVSVPMIDARSVERRPEYARHMARVSGLVPLPPKRLP